MISIYQGMSRTQHNFRNFSFFILCYLWISIHRASFVATYVPVPNFLFGPYASMSVWINPLSGNALASLPRFSSPTGKYPFKMQLICSLTFLLSLICENTTYQLWNEHSQSRKSLRGELQVFYIIFYLFEGLNNMNKARNWFQHRFFFSNYNQIYIEFWVFFSISCQTCY